VIGGSAVLALGAVLVCSAFSTFGSTAWAAPAPPDGRPAASAPSAPSSETNAPPLAPSEPSTPAELRVATKIFRPFVIAEQGNRLDGFTIELWEAVAKELGVETRYVMTNSVGDLLRTVSEGRADVGAAGITITAEREKTVDFSYPYFESGLGILVKQSPVSSPIVVLKTLFSQGLLEATGVIMVIVLIVAHVMWLVERRRSPQQFPHAYLAGIWEALWWSAVTVTTVGYGDKSPVGPLGRIVGILWMFAGMVLISYFTAAVTTELTIQRLEGSIQGPRDLTNKVIAAPKGSTAHQYLTERGLGTQLVGQIDEAYELLRAGEIDAVVYDAPVLQYYAMHEGSGEVAVVGSAFHGESYGFAMTEKANLRERVDRAMLTLRENGVYYRIHRKWFGRED
jgi:ABC-type amino acid transport substrate-binding protein